MHREPPVHPALAALTAEVLAAHPVTGRRFVLHVVDADEPGDRAAATLARHLEDEARADCPAGAPGTHLLDAEPDATTRLLVVLDRQRGLPAGAARLLGPGIAPAPDDAGGGDGQWDAWDLVALTVADTHRWKLGADEVVAELFRGAVAVATHHGARWLTATLDLVALDQIQRHAGHPFDRVAGAEPAPWLDSPAALAVQCELARWAAALRRTRPAEHARLFGAPGARATATDPVASRS